jgi:putative spermidine/putrescine transport system substrate-binding protein
MMPKSEVRAPAATPTRTSRRAVLTALGATALAAPFVTISGRARGADKVVAVNFGGAMGEAKRKAIYDPFTRDTGIEVVAVPGPDLAKIRAQVQSGDVEWDVVDLLDGWVPAGIRMGLLERIDDKIVDRTGCIPGARSDYAVGGSIYAGGIAYPTDRMAKTPKNWPDFWNVAAFAGRRGLRNRINDTLEIALMGDGVAAKDVYPCDVERAFKALDRIKPAVNHWIAQTAQTVSLIQSNETDFTYTYTTRVKDMQAANVQIGYSFEQNIMGVGWAGVVKGTPRKEAAMRLCSYIAKPELQVHLTDLAGDAPVYPNMLAKVDPAVRKWLPDVGDPNNLFVNAAWWDTRVEELTRRFQEWLLT